MYRPLHGPGKQAESVNWGHPGFWLSRDCAGRVAEAPSLPRGTGSRSATAAGSNGTPDSKVRCAPAKLCAKKHVACRSAGGSIAFVRRSFHPSKAAGKAVRIGHSCAAVTHHNPPPRGELARVQPIGSQPVKAEVRRARCARQIPKSKGPNSKVGGAIAPAHLEIWPLAFGVCAQGAPQMRSPKIRPWVLTRRARFLRAPFAKTSSQK